MSPREFDAWLLDNARPTLVMGVLNVTPDSFSDGGQFASIDAAVGHALAMAAEGADLIDVGGESTRPGSQRVGADEQLRRILPVLRALKGRLPRTTLSIDTTLAPVAEAALDECVAVVNDISAGRDDPALLPLVARRKCPVILMHMQGTPATMQLNPTYSDVTAEVAAFLQERLDAAVAAGVDPRRILLDPGIGFGKTVEHNLQLLRDTRQLVSTLGRPLVIGTSRKGFIRKVAGQGPDGDDDRRFGTAATVAWAVANGAGVVRVHDVAAMAQVVRVTRAIAEGDAPGGRAICAP
jgi:dihydropteroate synthase